MLYNDPDDIIIPMHLVINFRRST